MYFQVVSVVFSGLVRFGISWFCDVLGFRHFGMSCVLNNLAFGISWVLGYPGFCEIMAFGYHGCHGHHKMSSDVMKHLEPRNIHRSYTSWMFLF